jgi:hypothetical protein
MDENLRRLLSELAPEQPMNQDEQGGCVWCCGNEQFAHPRKRYASMYADRNKSHHFPGCPWVEARLLLGDNLPE